MSPIDTYLTNVSESERNALERLRKIVKSTVPQATEVITYGMPGFKYKGKYLIAFCEFRNHLSLFPGPEAIAAVKDKLVDYKTSKGTIQFTLENPIPESIIKEIVLHRVNAITSKN